MKKQIISIEDQVSAQCPNLLTEEVADVVERMAIYRETIEEAVVALRETGVML